MPELIVRCDCCGADMEIGREIKVDVENVGTKEIERWTLCKPCCRVRSLLDIANQIHQQTARST